MIDRDHAGNAKFLVNVVDVPLQVHDSRGQRREVLSSDLLEADSAVIFQGPDGGDDDRCRRAKSRLPAFDVDELLGAQIGAEAGLRHHIVRQFQGGARRNHRITAVGDIGKRAAVNDRRVVFQGLQQIRRKRLLQQHGHRAVRLELPRQDRLAGQRSPHDDVAQPLAQVAQIAAEAENRHDLRGDHDVESPPGAEIRSPTAEPDRNIPERAVIHIQNSTPVDAADIELEFVSEVDVIVDQGRRADCWPARSPRNRL